jgi:DNA-binding response OmpR family regulator
MLDSTERLVHPSRRNSSCDAIKLLLITPDDDLYLSVHNAAQSCGWELRRERTLEQGLHAVDSFPAGLVIYDWLPEANDWRFAIDRLSARPNHPCILLASRVVDEYLWAELVTHGGFDVIPRSANTEQLIRGIRFAHRATDIARGPLTR